jgi:hypothetical protein
MGVPKRALSDSDELGGRIVTPLGGMLVPDDSYST